MRRIGAIFKPRKTAEPEISKQKPKKAKSKKEEKPCTPTTNTTETSTEES